MRGGRSFLVLLVLALGLGAYIYFVESKREPGDAIAKKDKLFTIESGKIEEIEVRRAGGETARLKKSGDDWQIVGPETILADTAAASTIASTLESLEAQRTIDENPASVKEYELDPPRFSVAFKAAGESAMHTLNVGAKTPTGGDLYARVEGQPKVVLISAYVEDSLNRSAFDLRDKAVLKFSRDGVDTLVLEAAGQPTIEFARKADVWRLAKPVDAKAAFTPVDGIVGQVFQARMKSLESSAPSPEDIKKFGFDKPQARVTLGAGSTRATLEIGAKKDDTSLYARDVSRPLVFTVENALLDGVKRKADEFRTKELFEFRTFTAVGADFTYGGQTYSFKKEKAADKPADKAATPSPAATPLPTPAPPTETWKMVKPTAKDADQTKLTDLLTATSNLRVESFADKALASGEDLTVTVRFGDAAAPREERITFRKSGGVVHAIRQGEGGAAVIPTADFDKVVTQVKELAGVK
jgi:hypothetical protein